MLDGTRWGLILFYWKMFQCRIQPQPVVSRQMELSRQGQITVLGMPIQFGTRRSGMGIPLIGRPFTTASAEADFPRPGCSAVGGVSVLFTARRWIIEFKSGSHPTAQ
ncbi:hypothetical protein NPIL_611331 [Nephila pilipes]|uniref:Uncharacterized protein n=1 Tax=Nephila pilipes TaxID=299642 RepID=A0A8X6PWD0_NEPPI|nr:hypothetical protein NPIL_611331 [Nephila pilipes]